MWRSIKGKLKNTSGFTLVEMIVIAPIVILLIGGFIALIVNLTGEVMSSRGANVLTYDVQDALNRIEEDVKLSTTFLAKNNIDVSSTKQGYGGTVTTGSTVDFTNIDKSSAGGSSESLILNSLVTNGSPLSESSGLVYLKDQPYGCSDFAEYSNNKPMTMNIVYFVDASNTLWRRVIMPANYATASARCGTEPWQIPTCIAGYNATSLPFCKASDEKLIEGVDPSDFWIEYFSTASSVISDGTANGPWATDEIRESALQSNTTVKVSITAKRTVAGRDIERSASIRVTRLDTNASSIAKITEPTSTTDTPAPSGKVINGSQVLFTWPRVDGATSYGIDYSIRASGAACPTATGSGWTTGSTNLSNSQRTYTVTQGDHTDRVCVRVRAINSFGPSSWTIANTLIPLWAPLVLDNGWTDYGGGYSSAAYTRTKAGLVMLKGLIRKSSTPVGGEVLASLPPDYRPSGGALIFGNTISGNVWGRVDVHPSGDITLSTGNNGWVSLETIRFLPSTSGYSRSNFSLSGTWTNYSGGYAPGSYAQDSSGRVSIQGLVKGGTVSDGSIVSPLPASLAPAQYLHLATHAAGSGFSTLGIRASDVHSKGIGVNSYYSVNASYVPQGSYSWTNLTLQNGWVTYAGYATPQYIKMSDNVVHLKGLIRAGSISDGATVAALPAGFRPKQRMIYTVPNNNAHCRLDIHPAGTVTLHSCTSNAWLALESVSFVAEQ